MNTTQKTIGVLALQGDFEAHKRVFEGLGWKTEEVRTKRDLDSVDALVIPGGESTTLGKLLARIGLDTEITQRANEGMPLFGTCAGMIMLAKRIQDRPEQPSLQLMDITVARNAFGRQVESFETDIPFRLGGDSETIVHGVFIRAPYVVETGKGVEILSLFHDKIVAVRQGNRLAIAFHPELTNDSRVHAYFAKMVESGSITGDCSPLP